MSRIGRAPITIPAGVEVKVTEGNHITVKGPKGTLERDLVPSIKVEQDGNVLHVTRPNDSKENRSLHGLTRTLVDNMVVGVTHGFEKKPRDRGHPDRRSRCQPHRHQGYRQAEGRPVCSRGSWQASSRALQGQGREV